MKKEKSPILVISCILFLFLFIILPPVFRKYIPKEEAKKDNQIESKQELSILQCSRIFPTDLYQVTAKVKYINGSISTNTITYRKIETVPDDYQEPVEETPLVLMDEYNYLTNLPNIEKKAEEPNPILVINSNTIKNNDSDENLKLYFQDDITKQEEFYKEKGYTCNTMEA